MRKAQIYYARMDEFWRKKEKLDNLEKLEHIGNVEWQEIKPDKNYNWLTEGLKNDFQSMLPLAVKAERISFGKNYSKNLEEEATIFSILSSGLQTNRDVWAYNFDSNTLTNNIKLTIENYNEQVYKWNDRETWP